MSVTLFPYATNQPQDSFILQTQGLVQGCAYDDPSTRMELANGTLNSNETLPMWGGVPIEELINVMGVNSEGLGPSLKRATSQATITGWTVYNQASSMVIVPGNSAPVAGVGNGLLFYRYGTQARIAVQCDPALVAALVSADGSIVSQALYWDVAAYRITLTTTGGNFALPTTQKLLGVQTNSKIISYNSGTGAVTWTTGDAAILLL